MKNRILFLVVVLGLVVALAACSGVGAEQQQSKDEDYGEWVLVSASTCEQEGEEMRISKSDPNHVETRTISANGHEWGEWTVEREPTCLTDGVGVRVCLHDNNHKDFQVLTATGHTYGDWSVILAPTCVLSGSRERICLHDSNHIEIEALPALDHDYGDWVLDVVPTCTSMGVEKSTCRNDCNHTKIRNTPSLKHDYNGYIMVVAPTCEEDGVEQRTCKHDSTHVESHPILALGHDYGDWVQILAPTHSADGEEIRVCANDSRHIDRRVVPSTVLEGGGTEISPYLIHTVTDLNKITAHPTSHFRLAADLSLLNEDFYPLFNESNPFMGSFNGNGHKITNLALDSEIDNLSLFGVIGREGVVKNLVVEDFKITLNLALGTPIRIGAVAGYCEGNLLYIDVSGEINVSGVVNGLQLGGLVGESSGAVENCSAAVFIIMNGLSLNEGKLIGYIGGLAGSFSGNLLNNSALATIHVDNLLTPQTSAILYIGGMAGTYKSNLTAVLINDCHTVVDIISSIYANAGGLVGYVYTDDIVTVLGSSSKGLITGNSHAGGLISLFQVGHGSVVSHCSVEMNIEGYYAGGLFYNCSAKAEFMDLADGTRVPLQYVFVSNCTVNGKVQARYASGVFYRVESIGVINCSFEGESIGTVTAAAGFAYTARYSKLENCFAKGTVDSANIASGFIVTLHFSTLYRCYFEGDVRGFNGMCSGFVTVTQSVSFDECFSIGSLTIASTSASLSVGGLITRMLNASSLYGNVVISNCYSLMNIQFAETLTGVVGGLFGHIQSTTNITVSNCYFGGTISQPASENLNVGGIAGRLQPSSSHTFTFIRTYWLNSNGIENAFGVVNEYGNIVGEPTAADSVEHLASLLNVGNPRPVWIDVPSAPTQLIFYKEQ